MRIIFDRNIDSILGCGPLEAPKFSERHAPNATLRLIH